VSTFDDRDLTPETLRNAYGIFPSGVTAVCALVNAKPTGLAASSFTTVSLVPPLVSVCIAHTSTTWPGMRSAKRFGVSVLSADHSTVARSLAAKGADKFAGISWEVSDHGAVLVHGAALWLECSLFDQVRAGDHDIIILRVEALRPYFDVTPMVFHGSKFHPLAH
jgi:flavin reductase (DIM6/NTAB) family NADH-FMN oxidoreductase RutF